MEAFVRDVNRARALTVETVMKPPSLRITTENIEEALEQMRQTSEEYGYYINDDKYHGIVLQENLENARNNAKKLVSEALEDIPIISPDDLLERVIPETLDTEYPLPVVNEDGLLQGELSRASLAEVLGDHTIEETTAS